MSQSDYLKRKRIATQLQIDNDTEKQQPVFNSGTLLDYKEFELSNSIINTKKALNRLLQDGKQRVFGMDQVVSGCTTFPACTTVGRTNRVPLLDSKCRVMPLNIVERNAATNLKNGCKCVLNSAITDTNICSCKIGSFGIVR